MICIHYGYVCSAACLIIPALTILLPYSPPLQSAGALTWHPNTPRRTLIMAQIFRSYTFGRTSPILTEIFLVVRVLSIPPVVLPDAHGCTAHKNLTALVFCVSPVNDVHLHKTCHWRPLYNAISFFVHADLSSFLLFYIPTLLCYCLIFPDI